MSEYQYYRFERLDGYINSKTRQCLRDISSRADITTTSFQVTYHYSGLRAEPYEVMLKYFDIGFYFADWGSIDAYIKLPIGTIPEAILRFATDDFYVHQSDEWQLLIFSIEEYYEYFDDESADDFFQHLAGLRNELIEGDWRLLYFIWCKELEVNNELEAIPLIEFDFEHLNEGLLTFAVLYDIPLALVKALCLVLRAKPSHQVEQVDFQLSAWLNSLTEVDKNRLLSAIFEQGQLTRQQALAMTKNEPVKKEEAYQHWLTPDAIAPYIEKAKSQLQQEQAEALAKQLAIEKAEKEKVLTDIYSQREKYWQQAQEQANRTCASGYDQAYRYLHQLYQASQLKADTAAFNLRFQRFITANNNRKALLNRLSDLL